MKRLIFVSITFILVVSIFLFLIHFSHLEVSAANVIQTAFFTTGAKVVTSEIYMRGKLNAGTCISAIDRQLILSAVIVNAGGRVETVRPVFSEVETDILTGTLLDYIIDKNRSIHASILNERQGSIVTESVVSVSITDTSQKQELEKTAAGLELLLEKYSGRVTENICITGSIDGTLDGREIDAICGKILERAGAKKVEGLQEDKLISVSAFTPTMGNAVKVHGKYINLNVAVRYNSYEGMTYIWLASPVITTEY